MNKKIIAVAGLSIFLVACGNKGANTKVEETKNVSNTKVEETVKDNSEIKVSINAVEATEVFRTIHPNVMIKDISLENRRSGYVYDIAGKTETEEFEVEIDANTGEIIKEKSEFERDYLENIEITNEDLGKIDNLVQEALADAGTGFELYEWDVEADDGMLELNLELRKDRKDVEYKYNLSTGVLIEKELN